MKRHYKSICAGLSLLAAGLLEASEFFWAAPDMGNWDDPANWSPQGVPGPGDRASIETNVPLFTAGDRKVQELAITGSDGLVQVVGSKNAVLRVTDRLVCDRGFGRLAVIRGHIAPELGTLGLEAGEVEVLGGRLLLGQAHAQHSRALTSLKVEGDLSVSGGARVEIFAGNTVPEIGGIVFGEGGGVVLLCDGTGASGSARVGSLSGGPGGIVAAVGEDRRQASITLGLQVEGGRYAYAGRLRDAADGSQRANTVSLVKTGSGVQVLSGPNDYSGPTNVEEGELAVDGDQSAATGAVRVGPGGILSGVGTIGGATTVEGVLRPGRSGLSFRSDLSLAPASRLAVMVEGDPAPAYLGGGGTLRLGGTLYVRLEGARLRSGDEVKVFGGWSAVQGGFDGIQADPPGGGLRWDVSRLHTDGVLVVR